MKTSYDMILNINVNENPWAKCKQLFLVFAQKCQSLNQENRGANTRGGCRGLPLLPLQHTEKAHISFHS